jgi:aspartate aminotransferase-like enzyme
MGRKSYDAVFMTQVETSTGVLNPVREIGEILREHDAMFVVDAISSAGIEKLEMDNWSIDVTVSASQKGLECPAGLALVTVTEALLKGLRNNSAPGWYTNLKTWYEYYENWRDWHPFPVTLPTNTIVALDTSLKIIEEEGLGVRQSMYMKAAGQMRRALSALGLETLVTDEAAAHGLTAASTRGMFAPNEAVHYLKKRFGIQITGSFGSLADHVFRIGHMSRKQCTRRNLMNVISAIYLFMKSKGLEASMEEAAGSFVD